MANRQCLWQCGGSTWQGIGQSDVSDGPRASDHVDTADLQCFGSVGSGAPLTHSVSKWFGALCHSSTSTHPMSVRTVATRNGQPTAYCQPQLRGFVVIDELYSSSTKSPGQGEDRPHRRAYRPQRRARAPRQVPYSEGQSPSPRRGAPPRCTVTAPGERGCTGARRTGKWTLSNCKWNV